MSEARDRGICPRDPRIIESRMQESILGLDGEIPDSGLSPKEIEALRRSGKDSEPKVLRYMLALDLRFAELRGININDNLKLAAEEIIKNNSKGGV